MGTTTNIRSITWLKTHAAEALREMAKERRPLVLTQNGEARAVLVDLATWEERERALLLLKLAAQSEADIAAGQAVRQGEAFAIAEACLDQGD